MAEDLVYLIQGGQNYKIGWTTNLPLRVRTIQTYQAEPVKVIHTWPVLNGPAVEDYLHKKFNAVRMEGEWFHLTPDDVTTLTQVREWAADVPLFVEGTLRWLLRAKANVQSSQELGKKLGLSRQHAFGLWTGRDPLGLRLMRQIKEAYGISLDELAEVDEAVPGRPRERKRKDGS